MRAPNFTKLYKLLHFKIRMIVVWFDFRKRWKYQRALRSHKTLVDQWVTDHPDLPPPLLWDKELKDYTWRNRFNRKTVRKRITKHVRREKKLNFRHANR